MSTIFIERTVNLNGPIIPDTLTGVLNCGEADSHEFTISATLDNEPFNLSGVVTARFIRSDGVTVPLTGSISDGAAVVVLNNLCYNVPGRFAFTVFITSEGVTTAIYGCTGTVRQTDSGSIVDPGEIIPSVSGLITAIENAIAEIPADYSQLLATQAPTFFPSTPYVAGSYVWYDGTLYRFTADHAAGSWTGSDATTVTIGGELAYLNSALHFAWNTETAFIPVVPYNVNLDDYIGVAGDLQASKAGLFKINTTALANSIENIPEATAGLLICQNLSQSDRNIQIYITSASQHIHYRFHTNRGWQTWKQAASLDDLAAIKTEFETSITATNNRLSVKEDITSIFRGQPFYSHAFLGDADSAESASDAVIPSESIHDIEVSRRLGFKVIEANLSVTSDGEYIVIHGGENGTWGYEVSDINGNDISSTLISANPLSWVKENVRYRSKYSRFRTAPLEFKEWLKACRMSNMVPLFRFREAQNVVDADNIMGKYNYIVYNATRDDTDACISYYTNAYANADDLIAAFGTWTPPLIISCGNWSSWTDSDITRVVNWAHHEKGFLIGCAGNYLTQARVQKYWKMGFDMIGSTSNIGALNHWNLSSDSSDVGFSAFNTTGTVQSDGSLLLQPGQYIESINTDIQSVFLGGATLFFRASGSVNVYMYSKYMPTFGVTVAEETENQVSTLYIEQVPRFRIANPSTATSNAIIYSVDFRRSKL